MSLITALLMTWIALTWFKPLDYDLIYQEAVVQEVPLYEWTASRYDYKLSWKRRSRTHDTCALRIRERYKKYKVCSKESWKCITCYHNDYGPWRTDRVIDLSSHAFQQLAPLKKWLTEVQVYLINE